MWRFQGKTLGNDVPDEILQRVEPEKFSVTVGSTVYNLTPTNQMVRNKDSSGSYTITVTSQ
jgi:hypothetical protein